jgi:integrase
MADLLRGCPVQSVAIQNKSGYNCGYRDGVTSTGWKMKYKLNATQIKQAKPKDKLYKLTDGGGLYLEIKPNGGRFWRYRYRILGKENVFALGTYPQTSLSDARKDHEEARKLVGRGIHPAHHRQDEKQRQALEAENTFKLIAEAWMKDASNSNWSKTYRDQVERTLKLHVYPVLGAKPIAGITYRQLSSLLNEVYNKGDRKPAKTVAILLRQWISAIFRYAVREYGLENDPTGALKDGFKRPKVKHFPTLKKGDIPDFLKALDAYKGNPQTKIALNLLLLTFVRPGELRAAKWDEFDWKHEEWHIPAECMKMNAPHVVPLCSQVLDLLRELQTHTGEGEYLLPKCGGKKAKTVPYMPKETLNRALQYMKVNTVPHGFRGTASTLLNEMNYSPDWIEAQLAHGSRDSVRASYNHARYLPQRREMMQAWADFIDGLSAGAKVVPINQSA